ncbi:MAG: DNA polymerase III subunit alpha [Myxococcales bacterium]|nr:DNA polymerase III subunit alpha [Myxococcales bacterium]
MPYVELHAHSAFTFLESAALPEHLADRAADLGYAAMALTDRDDLGGHVRFLEAADKAGLRPIVGAELTVCPTPLFDGSTAGHERFGLVLLAEDAEGFANLSALVTKGRFERPRGRPYVTLEELAERAAGLVALTAFLEGPLAPARSVEQAVRLLAPYRDIFGDALFVEVQDHLLPEERRATEIALGAAAHHGLPVVATQHVHHVDRAGKQVEDVLRCIEHRCTLDQAGDRLFPNDERHLRGPAAVRRRFRHHPELLRNTLVAAERCAFHLRRDLVAPLPSFPEIVPGEDADDTLDRLTWEGAAERYGLGRPLAKPIDTSADPPDAETVTRQLRYELALVRKLRFAGYFLVLYDVVREARRLGILVQGRGSAANSAICYCLGVTAIDPIGRALLFDRFLSEGRDEPPDIDLDIEHERREELLQYVYRRYGRDHAAMVAAVHTYQPRQAARDVARALGFSADQGTALASLCDRWVGMLPWGGIHRGHHAAEKAKHEKAGPDGAVEQQVARRLHDEAALREAGLDPSDARVKLVPGLVERMVGLPRHRATHTGGFVLSERSIAEVCPVEWAAMPGRSVLQWEKDDLSTLGLVKFDLLGLGMLTVLRKHLDLVRESRGLSLDLWQLPHDDPAVYDDICAADTVGVFQIESRAQMNTLPRLRPRKFYDLVVEVALIRPGPIQGEMVHPYLRRRRGEEPVSFLHPSLEPHLARTLGVPLFQEQGMKVAIEVGGFSPVEADRLRRAMAHKRSRREMDELGAMLVERMGARGIAAEIAERIVKQLTAFADYGFPESHAASFALLVYASAWLRHHHPPEFYAAILNAQPMGFYAPSSLVEDAKRHGVEVRPPCVVASAWDCTVEPLPPEQATPRIPFALRVGLRYVRGLGERAKEQLAPCLRERPRSIGDLAARARLDAQQLLALAHADALAALEPERRRAVWEVLRVARGQAGPLDLPGVERSAPALPSETRNERIATDFLRLGLSVHEHPVALVRAALDARGVVSARALVDARAARVRVAGLVICRQRPATARGFVFLTLEDEGGMVNVIVEPTVFEAQRRTITGHAALEIEGELQRQQGVVNVKARTCRALPLPWDGGVASRDFH